ncbi:MAG: murein DD-endopeptidase MepM/ murein hydrolase activator NlpD [Saprospiraceae bacterium]|jgi:murein DD-endopeptidase MepM/ murein hydrolase activator NlpD
MLLPKKKKKKDFINKLSSNYRVTILKETSFEEKFSGNLTPIKTLFISTLVFFGFGLFFWFLYAHTPIKYHVPGYPHEEIITADIQNKLTADSIKQISTLNELYFKNLKALLKGEKIEDISEGKGSLKSQKDDLTFTISDVDSLARNQIEQENELDINESNLSKSKKFLEEVLLHKPLEGVLSDGVDFRSGHYGVDVSASEGTRVKSILTGTVVFSGFTASGGNEIHIQHDYNLISIYKHNSAVLKSAGDKIISGESVAIVGNSGEHSDGTHLHFEMWQKGTPLNPEDYFSF